MFNIRNPKPDELIILKSIWREAFGADGMESFFEIVYKPLQTIIVEQENKPAAMGYIIPAGEFVYEGVAVSCAMLYAIAVSEGHRGKGLGAAVTNALIQNAFETGYEAAVLSPTQDSLVNYYKQKANMSECFYAKEKRVSVTKRNNITNRTESGTYRITALTPAQYGELRETLLHGIAHIKHDIICLEYQQMLCDELGGGLYRIGNSCAVVEIQTDGEVRVKELLLSESDCEADVMTAINNRFPSDTYLYRCPAKHMDTKRFAMIITNGDVDINFGESAYAPWYGLAFE